VDLNPNLAMRFNVSSIPSVKAFRDGKVVSEFVGLKPEPYLKEFIRSIAPSAMDLTLEKGLSLMAMSQWKSAEQTFREGLEDDPGRTPALLGLSKSLLAQGQVVETQRILHAFPPSREFGPARTLQPLVDALIRSQDGQNVNDDPLEAAFNRALRLFTRGNIEAALDGFLDILREDKRYHNGEVRLIILSLFEIMGEENPLTRQYRQELASVLF